VREAMPFIPHTKSDVEKMLATIGAQSIEELFDEIPPSLRFKDLSQLPDGKTEMDVFREMGARARQDEGALNFIGAGAYEHHIPAVVWDIASRGEFMTAYTPYQAEASQGTLQLIYEFQSMMASLTGLDVSNASLYDGASATAEAVLMAIRANRQCKQKRVLIAGTLHPYYVQTIKTILHNQSIEVVNIPFDSNTDKGISPTLNMRALEALGETPFAAIVISQPNFFGAFESVHTLTDWAHSKNALTIGVVNPTSLALYAPPGEWGEQGADIAVGEGQPLGIPLASGGPYFGFLCCKQALVRQMPGRIIGRTVDLEGKEGFALTLQAREQHIRRSKATSNICTNQGLAVTAACIYMSLLGDQGLTQVAKASYHSAHKLAADLAAIEGVQVLSNIDYFHEFVIKLSKPVRLVLEHMEKHNILAGFDLTKDYPELGECLLVCATETRTEADREDYARALIQTLKELEAVSC
jgi:glycine dehydrogenase subunit 1